DRDPPPFGLTGYEDDDVPVSATPGNGYESDREPRGDVSFDDDADDDGDWDTERDERDKKAVGASARTSPPLGSSADIDDSFGAEPLGRADGGAPRGAMPEREPLPLRRDMAAGATSAQGQLGESAADPENLLQRRPTAASSPGT